MAITVIGRVWAWSNRDRGFFRIQMDGGIISRVGWSRNFFETKVGVFW